MAIPALFLKEAGKGLARKVGTGPSPDLFTTKKKNKPRPGEHWSNPLQEQHPDVNRFFVMNFEAATPETMGRALGKDFEVKHRGGLNFSIRKPGEKKWKVVDPDTWMDMLPFIGGDWSDIAGDAATGIGSMIGALITSPGVVTSAAGAAGGAAAVEAAKQALGKLLGSSVTAGEAAKSVAFEGALGAGGEFAAAAAKPLLGAGLKGLRRGLLGNVEEVAAKNLKAVEQAAKEAATGAGPIRAVQETPTKGLLGALRGRGAKVADDLSLAETKGMGELLDLPDELLRVQAAKAGVETTRKATVDEVRAAIVRTSGKAKIQGVTDPAAETLARINAGDTKEAARLGLDLDVPHEELAQKLFYATTEEPQQAAVGRQVGRVMEDIPVEAQMEIDFIARNASKEGRGAAGTARTFKGTQRAPLDAEAFREATAEVEGMSLAQAQGHLRKSGFEGDIPSTVDEVVDKLYARRRFGVKGTGSPEQLTGDEFLEGLYNVDTAKRTPVGKFPGETIGRTDISEIRAGGEVARTGREAVKPSGLRSAALKARPLVAGAGKAVEGIGTALRAPQKGFEKLVDALIPEKAGFTGAFMKSRPGMALMAGVAGGTMGAGAAAPFIAIGAAGLAGKGLQKLGHSLAADSSGQALIKVMTAAPADIAQKMLKPLEALVDAGPWKYRAALYTMMHDSDVREYLEDLDKTEAR